VNSPRPRRGLPVAFLLLLLLALLLTWALYGAVRDLLVTPVAYMAWLLWWDFVRLDQESIFVLVVLLGILNLVLLLGRAWDLPPSGAPKSRVQGPVSAWIDLLPLARQKGFVGQMPIRQLSLLLVNVLAQREQWPRAEIWARLRAGTLPLPAGIQAYLQTGYSQREKRAAVDPAEKQGHANYVTRETEALVQFLEDYMKPAATEEERRHD
jgi:membrane protein insertase Oxa1/YidC/SpoIIIJ